MYAISYDFVRILDCCMEYEHIICCCCCCSFCSMFCIVRFSLGSVLSIKKASSLFSLQQNYNDVRDLLLFCSYFRLLYGIRTYYLLLLLLLLLFHVLHCPFFTWGVLYTQMLETKGGTAVVVGPVPMKSLHDWVVSHERLMRLMRKQIFFIFNQLPLSRLFLSYHSLQLLLPPSPISRMLS